MLWSCTSDRVITDNKNNLNQYVKKVLEINSRYDLELLSNSSKNIKFNDFDIDMLQEALNQNNLDDIKELLTWLDMKIQI